MNQIDTVSKNNQIDPLTFLPEEVSMHILSYLKPSDLAGCNQVSKNWNRLSNDNILWKMIFSNLPDLKSKEDAKNYFMTHIKVNTMEILTEKIKLFFDTHKNNNEKIIAMQYQSASKPKAIWKCFIADDNKTDRSLTLPSEKFDEFTLKLEITGHNEADLENIEQGGLFISNKEPKSQSLLEKTYSVITRLKVPANYSFHHEVYFCDTNKIISISREVGIY